MRRIAIAAFATFTFAIVTFTIGDVLSTSCCAKEDSGVNKTPIQPNFLFIAIDDLNSMVGFSANEPGNFLQTIYPDPKVLAGVRRRLTPNLDRLAASSAPFLRSYCPSPLCGPSRTSLLTGTLPHETGYYNHDRHFRTYETLKNALTLPQHLKASGYFTTGIGKVFHSPKGTVDGPLREDWADARNSWSQWVNHPIGCIGGQPTRYSVPDASVLRFGPSRLELQDTGDYMVADFTANLLEHGTASTNASNGSVTAQTVTLPPDQPFFLGCGLFRPHLPFYAPKDYFELFPTMQMTGLNRASLDAIIADLDDLPGGADRFSVFSSGKMRELMQNAKQTKGYDIDPEVAAWREIVQAYLSCVCFADSCIGRIIDGLERSPRRDNTVVILWSDHGYHLGTKFHIAKQALWEEANRTVMIIRDPRVKTACDGKTRRQIVSLSDLYPTVCSLANVTRPSHVHGVDLTSLIQSADAAEVHDAVLMTYQPGNHAIRTPTHRFMQYADKTTEMYDMQNDAGELQNLATDTSHEEHLLLHELLKKQIGETVTQ